MKIQNNIVASIAMAIATLAMAGVVGSGAYAQAASAEARGVQALSTTVVQSLCTERAPMATLAAVSTGVAP